MAFDLLHEMNLEKKNEKKKQIERSKQASAVVFTLGIWKDDVI